MTVFLPRQEPFTCTHCGAAVQPIPRGTYRNHCPSCLYSRHVDSDGPGDRASECGGTMKPIAMDQSGKKGFVIVHKCQRCRVVRRNKAAPDDNLPCYPLSSMHVVAIFAAILLTSCFGESGTSVYSRAGERVGSVSVSSAESATVYGSDGSSVGRVSGDDIYDRGGSYVGRVTEGDDIYDAGGSYRGRVGSGVNCIDRSGTRVGYVSADIDDEAAGGSCLLLLLLNP